MTSIVNLANNKLYIGSAASLSNRKQKHLSDLNTGKHHNRYLQRVYNKYGKDYFIFKVVEYSEKESLLEREQFWIDRFDFKNELYNLTPTAGSSLGCKRSDEFRRKISEANKGKKLSDEHRNKISDSSKGKIISEKQRKIISEANKGKKLSDEHRNKISEANNGFTRSRE
jgi:group I intron endonuclease